jgi:hypothetical protein
MEPRKEIGLNMSIMEALILMSEGNPGAATVLAELAKREDGFIWILSLDDMNIRGTQIWVGYKDVCESNIEKFIEAIKKRDKKMIDYINEVGEKGNHQYKAVESGASKPNNREYLHS